MHIRMSEEEQTARGAGAGGSGVRLNRDFLPGKVAARRRVAIVARDEATVSQLRDWLHECGSLAICLRTGAGQSPEDIAEFLRAAEPSVVLYEVALPYAENLAAFRRVARAMPRLRYVLHAPCAELEFSEPGLAVSVLEGPFAAETVVEAVTGAREPAGVKAR
jgi:hypothetical protein